MQNVQLSSLKILAFFILFCSANHSNAQNFIVENDNHHKIIYRGFANKVTLGPIGKSVKNVRMECIHCEIKQLEYRKTPNTYIIRTKSRERTAQLNFFSNGQLVDSTVFVIQNLPAPVFFWGNNENGETIPSSRKLFVKYPSGITLKSDFRVRNWVCYINEEPFSGTGNVLSPEAMNQTKLLAKGEVVKIMITVGGSDSVMRKMVGTWVKD